MDDLVSDAEENSAFCEETSSEETEDVKVCDICGDVGEEKKLAVCSRCNDGAEHTYCMRVMIQEVPESGWVCEECQTEVEIEKENKKLKKSRVKVVKISSENKVDVENVGHKKSSKENQGNDLSIKRKEEDGGIIDKSEPRTGNVCCALCSSSAHCDCPSFAMETEEGTSGCTSSVKEEDGGPCIGVSRTVNKNKACHDHEQIGISEAKDMCSVASRDKRSNTGSEAKCSDEIEHVKVCDICGDVGEEEKLVICDRCNEGAEHIYCMQVMMEEVPMVKWLCEACQTEVGNEKERKKLEKTQVMVRASKGQSSEGKMNKPVNDLNCRSSSKNDMEAENVGSKESNIGKQSNGMATERKEEDAGITSPIRVPLSHERLLKLDAKKGKEPARQTPISLASNDVKNQAPPLRGRLSKSISFNNSKVPKVKQLVIEVPLKTKSLKGPLSCMDKQEGPSTLAKSTSFKKTNSSEPANKGKSSILPHADEPRIMNSLISRSITNMRGTSVIGYRSFTASMAAPVTSKLESTAQHLNKRNDMDNVGIAYGQGGRDSVGHSELKKSLVAKRPGSTLTSAETSSGMPGAPMKAIQENPPNLRPDASRSSYTMHCQRCNEVGHSTLCCPVDKFGLSAKKPLSEQTKDQTARSNRASEITALIATEEAILRSADQSEKILEHLPYHHPLYKPIDILCTSVSHGRPNEQGMRNGMFTPSSTASVDCPEPKLREHQAVSAIGRGFLDSSSSMFSGPTDKTPIFPPSDEGIASTFPELAYVWQGCFELWRTGRSPELCEGLQAHLSCSASPKVLQMAKKFPSKIQLEELPRQNLCPTWFNENDHLFDSIGLFFFATDTKSYESHYSQLVGNMLKDDLILRGNIERAELLIFSSNILSKNFQRWNMFYYLWGVFRVRRENQNLPPQVPTSKCSNFNEDLSAVDLRSSVFSSGRSFPKDQNDSAESDPTLLKSDTRGDSKCQVVPGKPLQDHREDLNTASFFNSSINDVTAPARKNQKLADKMWDSSNEPGKRSTTVNRDNADHLMDVDHVNTTEVSPRNADHTSQSHGSGGAHTRNVEIANWPDEVMMSHKKIKLDNGCSVNPMLG